MAPKSRSKQKTAAQKRKRRDEPGSQDEGSNTDVQALDSDNLDDDSDADTARRGRKAGAERKKRPSAAKPRKRRREAASEEEESDLELKEGQEVVGKIVRAPKTGQGGLRTSQHRAQLDPVLSLVPPGQISRNTFNFLTQLGEPACNDREWLVSVSRGYVLNPAHLG